MKKSILAMTLLLSTFAQADIIKCDFTEPFVGTTYSMTKSTLTYEAYDQSVTTIKNVSFQIKDAATFQLIAKDGKVLQTLKLDFKGSNGMSDTDYPYSAVDKTSNTNFGIGGCTSNFLKAKKI